MKTLKIIRELTSVLLGLIALYQVVVSNEQRAQEHFETTAQVCALAEKVDAQNERFEAAFRTQGETE